MPQRKRQPRNGGRKDIAVYRNIPSPQVYHFTRMVKLGLITNTAVDGGSGRFFMLQQVPSYTEITNLFTQYRISRVDLVYMFKTHILPSGKAYPRITFGVDYSDATTPLLESDVLQLGDSETFQFGQVKHTFERSLVPRVATALYQGAFSGYGTAPSGQWIDCDSPTVQYYGTKEWLSDYNTTLASGAQVELYVRYHIDAKLVR